LGGGKNRSSKHGGSIKGGEKIGGTAQKKGGALFLGLIMERIGKKISTGWSLRKCLQETGGIASSFHTVKS